jgi:SAM-dependent methyltransferase
LVTEVLALIALEQRDRLPELMDQPGLDERVHRQALRGLGRTNAFSRVGNALWRGLAELGAPWGTEPVRVLDMASGGGDNLLRLAQLARRHNVRFEAQGCDINPTAVAYAQAAAQRANLTNVRFAGLDAVRDPLPQGFDVFMCTLFLHHLTEPDVVDTLQRMAGAARRGVLVDDLVRTRFGYALAWAGGRLLTRSPIVHTDGPLSVRAAFTLDEFRALAERAGLRGATFHRHWPQRFLFAWRKP